MSDIEQPLVKADYLEGKKELPPSSTLIAVFHAIITCMGNVAFGYQLGFTSPISSLKPTPAIFGDNFATFSSVISVGAMVGGLAGGPIADAIGRKTLILAVALPYTGAMIGYYFGQSISILIFCRLVSGLCAGFLSLSAPLLLTESAPKRLRGALGGGAQLGVTVGIVFAYGCGIPIKDNQDWWRIMALIGIAPIAVQFLGLLLLFPESPVWLLQKGRSDAEVEHALKRLRGGNYNAEPEIAELKAGMSSRESTVVSTSADGSKFALDANIVPPDLSGSGTPQQKKGPPAGCPGFLIPLYFLCSPKFVRPLIVAAGLQILQQATGINAVIFYLGKIFSLANTDATTGSVIVGIVQVAVTFLSCLLMEKAGRRPLLLVASVGMGLALVLLGFCFQFDKIPGGVTVFGTCAYIAFFSLAMGPIPWFITSEIFPAHVRGGAMSIATVLNWGGAFAIVQATPLLLNATAPGSFWIFAGVCFLSILFVLTFVPETKGKTYEQIEREMSK